MRRDLRQYLTLNPCEEPHEMRPTLRNAPNRSRKPQPRTPRRDPLDHRILILQYLPPLRRIRDLQHESFATLGPQQKVLIPLARQCLRYPRYSIKLRRQPNRIRCRQTRRRINRNRHKPPTSIPPKPCVSAPPVKSLSPSSE